MTMKKKILTTLSVVLILGMAALGILAYLTDTDQDVNVMTLGNVQIDQIEDFEQGAALDPSVTVTKEVTVKNVGESAAYVRTWLAFENPMDKIEPVWGTEEPTSVGVATIDGTEYTIYVADYGKMEADQTIVKNPLDAVKMKPEATNEDVAKYGDTYEVLVFSQAIQAAGFTTSDAAWTAHFGAATIANHPWKETALVATADELVAAFAEGKNAVLTDDINMDVAATGFTVAKGTTATLDLNGFDIIATSTSAESVQLFSVNGNLDIVGDGTISLTSDNFGWTTSYRYCAINVRETGVVTLGEGVEVVCEASKDGSYGMSYAVDIYTTGTLNVNGASLHSNYIAVRCFFGNSVVNVNSGSITSSNKSYGIWPQSSPDAVITIAEGIDYEIDEYGIYIFK